MASWCLKLTLNMLQYVLIVSSFKRFKKCLNLNCLNIDQNILFSIRKNAIFQNVPVSSCKTKNFIFLQGLGVKGRYTECLQKSNNKLLQRIVVKCLGQYTCPKPYLQTWCKYVYEIMKFEIRIWFFENCLENAPEKNYDISYKFDAIPKNYM